MDIWLVNQISKNKNNENNIFEGFSINKIVGVPGFLASFLVSLVTAYLCWNVNKDTKLPLKIFYSILAFTFSGIYLIYYFLMYFTKNKNILNDFDYDSPVPFLKQVK
jgi:hypothetical protein